MRNAVISETRKVRKKLDKEFHEKPSVVKTRWKEIERSFKGKVVRRNPKYLKNSAA